MEGYKNFSEEELDLNFKKMNTPKEIIKKTTTNPDGTIIKEVIKKYE